MYSDDELPDLDDLQGNCHLQNTLPGDSVPSMRKTAKNDFFSDSSDVETESLPLAVQIKQTNTLSDETNQCKSLQTLRNRISLCKEPILKSNDSKPRVRKTSALLRAAFDGFVSDNETGGTVETCLKTTVVHSVSNHKVEVVERQVTVDVQFVASNSLPLKSIAHCRKRNVSALLRSAFDNFSSDEDTEKLNKKATSLSSLKDTESNTVGLEINVKESSISIITGLHPVSIIKPPVKVLKSRVRNQSELLCSAFVEVDSDGSDDDRRFNRLVSKTCSLSDSSQNSQYYLPSFDNESLCSGSTVSVRTTSSSGISSLPDAAESLTTVATKRKKMGAASDVSYVRVYLKLFGNCKIC